MCVPLKLCGRFTYMLKVAIVCCSPAERSLHPHRVADVLDADPVDGDLARVGAALHVLDRSGGGGAILAAAGGCHGDSLCEDTACDAHTVEAIHAGSPQLAATSSCDGAFRRRRRSACAPAAAAAHQRSIARA